MTKFQSFTYDELEGIDSVELQVARCKLQVKRDKGHLGQVGQLGKATADVTHEMAYYDNAKYNCTNKRLIFLGGRCDRSNIVIT